MPTVFLEAGVSSTAVTTALSTAMTTTANNMLSAIGSLLPTALSVAGAILVVTMGWRLFRNFTHG